MSDVISALGSNRAAVQEFLTAANGVASTWASPRAPGKWSPSQVTEHVARTYEEGAKLVTGSASKFPTVPSLLRPVMRGLFFKRILKKGTFMKAKTFEAFDPATGPASPADGRTRMEGALDQFEAACRQAGETVTSGVFGRVSTVDYVRFQELHTRHHQKQLFVDGSN